MFAIQWLCILAKVSNIPMQKEYRIRPVQLQDNKSLVRVLREVLLEFGVPKEGTAYADPELDDMFHTYAALRLYTAAGFVYVDTPIGNTGHYSCPVWMTKSLV